MAKELAKAYEASNYEDKIYQSWVDSGFFNPDILEQKLEKYKDASTYTIILPPPNITDKLHMGHAAMLAIQDLFARYHRQKGERVLWLPGTDHAAIATQTVVEKKLKAETGQSRHDLGREEFLKKVWEFIEVTQSTILKQIKKMGSSLDWSRLAFTLDQERQAAVTEMFCRMHQAGLIYRGDRIVNWCPHCASTLADDEVDYQEQPTKLYTFKYDQNFPIAIATTRPETKLGDTAVAVNPKDERYQQYLGQEFTANFCGQNLKIKIIGDPQVDQDFGTGALGVTPGHSMTDWLMAQEHDLPLIKVIDEQAKIKEGFGQFSGLLATEARQKIVAELQAAGLLVREEEITHNLSVCYRCGTPLEPLTSLQWFVDVGKPVPELGNKSLKERASEVVEREAKINFYPERFSKRYLDWMHNLRDWCISRQLWFGHSIPVWYKNKGQANEEVYVGPSAPTGADWQPETDTLDTWFSSGMWTFSTLGWPQNFANNQKSGDLAKFHPTQLMETGYEIITLWVSRMIMMSLFALQEVPFSEVYLHGMVLDKNGKKMSKSKGNGIDPLDMIAKYGTDAVRLSLLIGTTPGNDSKMFEEKIAGYRNFVNKLWNVARFMLTKIDIPQSRVSRPQGTTLAQQWILAELDNLIKQATQNLDRYDFSALGEELKEFTWNKLADWYLEIAKVEEAANQGEVLNYILNTLLKLWHPFMPFVTESLWQEIYNPHDHYQTDNLLMVEEWPQAISGPVLEGKDILLIQDLVTKIRNVRSENKIKPATPVKAVIYSQRYQTLLQEHLALLTNLRTGLSEITISESGSEPDNALRCNLLDIDVFLIAEVDPQQEKARLIKELASLEEAMKILEAKLADQEFISKAPPQVVKKEREKLNDWQLEYQKMKNSWQELAE